MVENICPFMSRPVVHAGRDGREVTVLCEVECRGTDCRAWGARGCRLIPGTD